MCLRKIWPQRFLDSPHHLLDGFWGPKDGFFGFSSGGYRERGAGERMEALRFTCEWGGKKRIEKIGKHI